MRIALLAIGVVAALTGPAALAQDNSSAMMDWAAAAASKRYSSSSTLLGKLLDDPKARALLDKHIPGLTSNPQIAAARGMTLKAVQKNVPDKITDKVLADLDADLVKLSAK
jgi:para-nitrobenzyl esterase